MSSLGHISVVRGALRCGDEDVAAMGERALDLYMEALTYERQEAQETLLALIARNSALIAVLREYADLDPDEIPFEDTINDPPDIGRPARELLEKLP